MRFPILFTGINTAMVVIGVTRSGSYVDVGPDVVRVRLGWAFRATIDRAAVRSADHDHDRVWGWGAHGWRGRWLVNGSSSGLVRVEIDPRARAWVVGVPVRLTVLRVSVTDPDGLIDALGSG